MKAPAIKTLYRYSIPHPMQRRIAALRQRARHLGARMDPKFRQSHDRLAALRHAYAGEACAIIGNGPSMRDFDLSQLAGLRSFCLNRGYLMWKEQGRQPDFMIAVNQLIIEQFGKEWQAVTSLKFAPWLHRSYLDEADDSLILFEERWDEAFITDARNGLASMATVTNTALQLAYHMGFTKVVLLGIDHHFSASTNGRPHQLVVQAHEDIDHFRPDYFEPGTRWHLPDLAMSERGYRRAKCAFEKVGARILNATPGTRLDVFEKANHEDVLRDCR